MRKNPKLPLLSPELKARYSKFMLNNVGYYFVESISGRRISSKGVLFDLFMKSPSDIKRLTNGMHPKYIRIQNPEPEWKEVTKDEETFMEWQGEYYLENNVLKKRIRRDTDAVIGTA